MEAETTAASAVANLVTDAPFDEPGVVSALDATLGDFVTLVAGNSMPLRDLDAFLPVDVRDWSICGNRGANGIDGQVSSAMGIAAGSVAPTVLLAGDLTVLHDLGGLVAARRLNIDLTVVVVDNNGGGIFSFLPIANQEHVDHHRLFHTPHGLDLSHAAALADATYHQPTDRLTLETALVGSVGAPGLHVVHIKTDAAINVKLHREATRVVDYALHDLGAGK
tara:strand:+ start:114 stop:779 length:666 start_codon:yes stop_codon:yes gene_type:complete